VDPQRRNVLSRLAMWVSLAASYGTAALLGVRYLYPRRKPVVMRSIFVARLDDLADGESRVVKDLYGNPVSVVRDGKTLRALSTVCPHLGCRTRWEGAEQRFFCPCHNAAFDKEGQVLSGPPPRPLDRYDLEIVAGVVYLRVKDVA
jgi:Rieske Fe-S protein